MAKKKQAPSKKYILDVDYSTTIFDTEKEAREEALCYDPSDANVDVYEVTKTYKLVSKEPILVEVK